MRGRPKSGRIASVANTMFIHQNARGTTETIISTNMFETLEKSKGMN
jgi:hypothetical protein